MSENVLSGTATGYFQHDLLWIRLRHQSTPQLKQTVACLLNNNIGTQCKRTLQSNAADTKQQPMHDKQFTGAHTKLKKTLLFERFLLMAWDMALSFPGLCPCGCSAAHRQRQSELRTWTPCSAKLCLSSLGPEAESKMVSEVMYKRKVFDSENEVDKTGSYNSFPAFFDMYSTLIFKD